MAIAGSSGYPWPYAPLRANMQGNHLGFCRRLPFKEGRAALATFDARLAEAARAQGMEVAALE